MMKYKYWFSRFVARLSSNTLLLRAIIDNSVYSVMICDYLQVYIPDLELWYYRILIGIITFGIIIVFNLFGIDAVGWS